MRKLQMGMVGGGKDAFIEAIHRIAANMDGLTGSNFTRVLSSYATQNCRTPGRHPEGYLEAFGNIYRNFAQPLLSKMEGTTLTKEMLDFTGVNDGVRGMAFIEYIVASGNSYEKCTDYVI
jgi:hypothetical protein